MPNAFAATASRDKDDVVGRSSRRRLDSRPRSAHDEITRDLRSGPAAFREASGDAAAFTSDNRAVSRVRDDGPERGDARGGGGTRDGGDTETARGRENG